MSNTFVPVVAGSIVAGATAYTAQTGTYTSGGAAGVNLVVDFDGGALAASGSGDLVIDGLPLTQAAPPQGIPSGFLIINGAAQAVTLFVAQGTSQIRMTANGRPVSVSSLSGAVTLRGGLIVNT
jgi:hypothetical protein